MVGEAVGNERRGKGGEGVLFLIKLIGLCKLNFRFHVELVKAIFEMSLKLVFRVFRETLRVRFQRHRHHYSILPSS